MVPAITNKKNTLINELPLAIASLEPINEPPILHTAMGIAYWYKICPLPPK